HGGGGCGGGQIDHGVDATGVPSFTEECAGADEHVGVPGFQETCDFADPRTGGPRALDAVQTVLLPGDQVGAIEEVQKLLPGFGPARNSTSSDQNWVKFGGAGIVYECAQLEHGRPCVLGQDPTQRSGCAGTGTFVVTQHQCTQPVTEDCVLGRHDLGRGVGLGVAAGQYPIHGRGAAPNPVAGQV